MAYGKIHRYSTGRSRKGDGSLAVYRAMRQKLFCIKCGWKLRIRPMRRNILSKTIKVYNCKNPACKIETVFFHKNRPEKYCEVRAYDER